MKGIFKVLNPNHRLPSPRMNSEDEAPTGWSTNDAEVDGVELAG